MTKRIIALSPHPDDVEFSISGSIIKFDSIHFKNITLSRGGDFDPTTEEHNRLSEVKNFWRGIENVENINLDNKYIKLLGEDELINNIETMFNISEFDFILTPPFQDTHFEHRITNNVAHGLARKNKIGIIEYNTPSTLKTWIPNLSVDITFQFEEKSKRLQNFTSQKNRLYFDDDTIANFNRDFSASKRGIKYVELLKIISFFS